MPTPPLLFALLLATLLLSACGAQPLAPKNGEAAPGFTARLLEGGELRVPEQLRGKVVALRFWADWCPFCEQEMADLEPLYRALKARGLEILAINVRQDDETVRRFTGKLGISYPVLLDAKGEVARRYAVMGLPTTFFIDGSGVLRQRILGESTPESFGRIVTGLLP
ncbi:MAG: TlpA family protein disulfide reductase [Gammaproteobacteria bacterium]|nr:TlpA family protein disulfide reductase [Gammaproteobacteria bacterium]